MANMSLDFVLSSTLECYPLTLLKSLVLAGKLGRFTAHWHDPKVDSHKITRALAADLRDAPPMPVRWHCYTADRPPAGSLSWVECDGWAIDTGNAGPGRPVTILRESEFRNDECSPFGGGLTTAAWSQRTQGARKNSPFADSPNLLSRLYRRRAALSPAALRIEGGTF